MQPQRRDEAMISARCGSKADPLASLRLFLQGANLASASRTIVVERSPQRSGFARMYFAVTAEIWFTLKGAAGHQPRCRYAYPTATTMPSN